MPANPATSDADDKRLERLYDYTKFHIGIYLSAAAGLVTLMSTAAESAAKRTYLASLIGLPRALAASFILLVVAGIAGALVATSAIRSTSYESLLEMRRGLIPLPCRCWISIEHYSFWLSLIALASGILSAATLRHWLGLGEAAMPACVV